MRVCNIKKGFLWPLSILVVFTLILSGCGTSKNKTTGTSPTTVLSRPHPPVRKGDINTDTKILEVTQSVDTSGGMVVVSKPGDPLDGLVIDVPSAAYSGNTTFSVSSAPITSQTFGSDITPISPMIYVDDGGTYSNDMMYIRVPVQVPADDFAMGFIYDVATKQLEGMPLISTDADSVTVGTRHFSNFFISMISKSLLDTDIDSHFRPGIDDWQFTNWGSYIAPGGHCEGQSLSALWYYCTQPDGKDLCLYGRYDNNGNQPATPDFWYDDSLGYRFCSVVQQDIDSSDFANGFWENLSGKSWVKVNNQWKEVDVPGIGDEATWDLFAYSMEATKEPQLICIESNTGVGHAMICYRIYQGNLYIADPNYYGNTERRIEYKDGKFTPYNSGANRADIDAGNGMAFETIQYYAKSTVMPWDQIAQEWAELKDGTIGDNVFPSYHIVTKDSEGHLQPLTDGYISDSKSIYLSFTAPNSSNMAFWVYRDGNVLEPASPKTFVLQPGTNKLGFYMQKKVGDVYKYVDFQYINVTYQEQETSSAGGSLVYLQKMPHLRMSFDAPLQFALTSIAVPSWNTTDVEYKRYSVPSDDSNNMAMGIQWNGTSFTGKPANPQIDEVVTGTVSADGETLLSLVDTFNSRSSDTDSQGNTQSYTYTRTVKLKNVPLKVLDSSSQSDDFSQSGVDIQKYVESCSVHSTTTQNGQPYSDTTIGPPVWDSANSDPQNPPQLSVTFRK